MTPPRTGTTGALVRWRDRDKPPMADVERLASLSGCCSPTIIEAYRGTAVPPSATRKVAEAANKLCMPVPRAAFDLRRAARGNRYEFSPRDAGSASPFPTGPLATEASRKATGVLG